MKSRLFQWEVQNLCLEEVSAAMVGFPGYFRGFEFAWQALQDERISGMFLEGLAETANAFTVFYNEEFDIGDIEKDHITLERCAEFEDIRIQETIVNIRHRFSN